MQIGAAMTAVPVLVILSAAVLLGLYLGLLYLRGERKPVLIGVHFLLGVGGLEALVMLMHGTPGGDEAPAGYEAAAASAAHAGVGAIGFMLLLYWVSSP